jgi:phenylacetate-CoA ligase
MRIFDLKYETLRADELAQLQLERLQALLVRLKRNVRRHRESLGSLRLSSLADVPGLPITQPEDLAGSFPYGMFALPLREVIRLHSLVGPEGKQLVTGHTKNDLAFWGRLVARQLVATGMTANDVIQICLGEGRGMDAAGYVLGAQTIEASVIAEDPFHNEYQLAMLQNYRPTVLITTPTNARELANLLNRRRLDPQSLYLRTVLLSRPVSPGEREELESGLFARVQCNFGIDEILNPGFCVECPEGNFHVNEDQFLVEVHQGELLVTTLCREAMPLLRYATRIAAEIVHLKCPCGRIGAVLRPGRRLDNRLCVNETCLYEKQIHAIIAQTRAAGLVSRLEITDRRVIIDLDVTADLFDDVMRTLENVKLEVQSELLSRLGIEAEVRFVVPAKSFTSSRVQGNS